MSHQQSREQEDFKMEISGIIEGLEESRQNEEKALREGEFKPLIERHNMSKAQTYATMQLTEQSSFFPSLNQIDHKNVSAAFERREQYLDAQIEAAVRKKMISAKEHIVKENFGDNPEQLKEAEKLLGLDKDREWLANGAKPIETERVEPIDLSNEFNDNKGDRFYEKQVDISQMEFPGLETQQAIEEKEGLSLEFDLEARKLPSLERAAETQLAFEEPEISQAEGVENRYPGQETLRSDFQLAMEYTDSNAFPGYDSHVSSQDGFTMDTQAPSKDSGMDMGHSE
ncbi:MAG: hypothetical protein AAF694_04200 [Bacteroidota bacterium]